MDKITRILLLYARLIQGGKINKMSFCMETDCLPRTFDRDIEDIRLYLSELFESEELIYDRSTNTYYLNGMHRKELETMEYKLIERILLDTRALRYDEMDNLLQHLASNTDKATYLVGMKNELIKEYKEPMHKKAILKMHGDLDVIIRNQAVINIKYEKADNSYIERIVLPCTLKYDKSYLYLVAFIKGLQEEYPAYFRLDRIYSFEILRSQNSEEKEKVQDYLCLYAKGITQMYGGEYTEIELTCTNDFYSYLYDNFKKIEIISREKGKMHVKLWAFSKGFVKWIMSQPCEKVKVIAPENIRKLIAQEVEQLIILYGNRD